MGRAPIGPRGRGGYARQRPRRGEAGVRPHGVRSARPVFLGGSVPTYAQFREHAPVFWVEPYESYWVFGYEDTLPVFNDSNNFGPAPDTSAPAGFIRSRRTRSSRRGLRRLGRSTCSQTCPRDCSRSTRRSTARCGAPSEPLLAQVIQNAIDCRRG